MTPAHQLAEKLTEAQRRSIPGYEGRYEIDDLGNIYSLARSFRRFVKGYWQVVKVPAKQLTRTYSRKGYPQVTLYNNNKGKCFEIHRLVCRVFHGEPAEGHEAAHLDGVKDNCTAENVAWSSRSENALHKWDHGTMLTGERVPTSVLKMDDIQAIITMDNGGVSKRQIARTVGVSDKVIRNILAGRSWRAEAAAVRAHLLSKENER